MKVKIHTLFQYLLDTTEAQPEASSAFRCPARPGWGRSWAISIPTCRWTGTHRVSGPARFARGVIRQAGLDGLCPPMTC